VRGQDGHLGKTAVAVDADGDVAEAKVDPAAQALVAAAAGDVRVAGDQGAEGQGDPRSRGDDFAREFMAQGHGRGAGKLALEEMPVGAADAGGADTDQHLAGAGGRVRNLHHLDPSHRLQLDCAHP
jgi:hypothetical protein